MRRRFGLALLATVTLFVSVAKAGEVDGYRLPDRYPVAGQTLVLNGLGVRTLTILRVRVYVAGLYLTAKSGDAPSILASKAPKVILMQFLHSASKSDIEKQYREGETRNCGHGECPKADETDFERLIQVTPARAVGETLTYIILPTGLRVLAGDAVVGEFPNPDLAMRVLAGFIGATPASPDLKAALLGS